MFWKDFFCLAPWYEYEPIPPERYSFSGVSWVFPGPRSGWDVPRTPLSGKIRLGCFRRHPNQMLRRAALLFWVPPGWASSHSILKGLWLISAACILSLSVTRQSIGEGETAGSLPDWSACWYSVFFLQSLMNRTPRYFHFRRDLIPDPERVFHPFPTGDYGFKFGGADSHPPTASHLAQESKIIWSRLGRQTISNPSTAHYKFCSSRFGYRIGDRVHIQHRWLFDVQTIHEEQCAATM